MANTQHPAGANGGAQPRHLRAIALASVSRGRDAGTLDLKASVDQLDTYNLAYQAACLVNLPDGIRRLAAPRLALVLAERAERAMVMLEEGAAIMATTTTAVDQTAAREEAAGASVDLQR